MNLDLIEGVISTLAMMEQNTNHPALPWTLLLFKIRFSESKVWHMLGDISGAANIYIITGCTDMRNTTGRETVQ